MNWEDIPLKQRDFAEGSGETIGVLCLQMRETVLLFLILILIGVVMFFSPGSSWVHVFRRFSLGEVNLPRDGQDRCCHNLSGRSRERAV